MNAAAMPDSLPIAVPSTDAAGSAHSSHGESVKTEVSIVLPTFNRASFLVEAFESIRAQTFTDWKLIIVDDGSEDDTRELCESFIAECQNPVIYIYQENAGAAAARNHCLDYADSPLIAFFDSDDLWEPWHLGNMVAILYEHEDIDWVYGDARRINATTGELMRESIFHDGYGSSTSRS